MPTKKTPPKKKAPPKPRRLTVAVVLKADHAFDEFLVSLIREGTIAWQRQREQSSPPPMDLSKNFPSSVLKEIQRAWDYTHPCQPLDLTASPTPPRVVGRPRGKRAFDGMMAILVQRECPDWDGQSIPTVKGRLLAEPWVVKAIASSHPQCIDKGPPVKLKTHYRRWLKVWMLELTKLTEWTEADYIFLKTHARPEYDFHLALLRWHLALADAQRGKPASLKKLIGKGTPSPIEALLLQHPLTEKDGDTLRRFVESPISY